MSARSLLSKIDAAYSGARRHFIYARLSLKTGLDLQDPTCLDEVSAGDLERLMGAIREICLDVRL